MFIFFLFLLLFSFLQFSLTMSLLSPIYTRPRSHHAHRDLKLLRGISSMEMYIFVVFTMLLRPHYTSSTILLRLYHGLVTLFLWPHYDYHDLTALITFSHDTHIHTYTSHWLKRTHSVMHPQMPLFVKRFVTDRKNNKGLPNVYTLAIQPLGKVSIETFFVLFFTSGIEMLPWCNKYINSNIISHHGSIVFICSFTL